MTSDIIVCECGSHGINVSKWGQEYVIAVWEPKGSYKCGRLSMLWKVIRNKHNENLDVILNQSDFTKLMDQMDILNEGN